MARTQYDSDHRPVSEPLLKLFFDLLDELLRSVEFGSWHFRLSRK